MALLGRQRAGCTVPELDPALLRIAIEQVCATFSNEH